MYRSKMQKLQSMFSPRTSRAVVDRSKMPPPQNANVKRTGLRLPSVSNVCPCSLWCHLLCSSHHICLLSVISDVHFSRWQTPILSAYKIGWQKNRPISVWYTPDKINRFCWLISLADKLAVELGSNFAEKIGQCCPLILSVICCAL